MYSIWILCMYHIYVCAIIHGHSKCTQGGSHIDHTGRTPLSKEATVYNYRLTRKIHFHFVLLYLYVSLIPFYFIFTIIRFSFAEIFPGLLCFAFTIIIHAFLPWLILKVSKMHTSSWAFVWNCPWIGYMPKQYIPYSLFSRIQFHMLWVGPAFIGAFVPWISAAALSHLLFIHLWLLLPRIAVLFFFRGELSGGFVKLNNKEAAYYSN